MIKAQLELRPCLLNMFIGKNITHFVGCTYLQDYNIPVLFPGDGARTSYYSEFGGTAANRIKSAEEYNIQEENLFQVT